MWLNIILYFILYVSGKWWGPKGKQAILALHGFQDNAGTFDELINLLPANLSILAIDFPGHGQSSHLPPVHSLSLFIFNTYFFYYSMIFSGIDVIAILYVGIL